MLFVIFVFIILGAFGFWVACTAAVTHNDQMAKITQIDYEFIENHMGFDWTTVSPTEYDLCVKNQTTGKSFKP